MKTKLATALLLALAIGLTGCEWLRADAPVISGIIATNELGLYTAGISVIVEGSPLLVWDFGDGNKGTGVDPVHDYGRPGAFRS